MGVVPGMPLHPAPPRPWVLLFVDDEPDILDAIKGLLEASMPGLVVLTARSGRDAMELLARERVDLLMSDFKMPGMDGLELLFQARRLHPHIPRVMFTAFQSEDLARRAVVEAMVSAFLSKTVDPDEMIKQIGKLLRYEPSSALPPVPGQSPRPEGAAAGASG